jgi:hypothetical protein
MTIFVSVAAYLEPRLEFTLNGLFSEADQPDEIRVGLVDQSDTGNRSWLSRKPYWSRIRYVQINPVDARGVSWARSLASSLFEGEDYFLQIDSHTFFLRGWDTVLREQLATLLGQTDRPLITTYPPAFEFDEQDRPYPAYPSNQDFLVIRPEEGSELKDNSATLPFKVHRTRARNVEFIEGFHIGCGFIFTLGRFVEAIPYDPYMYFRGEEQNLALRAYTHGWSIFHPLDDNIPLYHLYKRLDRNHPTNHWHPDLEAQRQVKWTEHHRRSEARLIALIRDELEAPYGLGTERTVGQFIALSQIDYGRYRTG